MAPMYLPQSAEECLNFVLWRLFPDEYEDPSQLDTMTAKDCRRISDYCDAKAMALMDRDDCLTNRRITNALDAYMAVCEKSDGFATELARKNREIQAKELKSLGVGVENGDKTSATAKQSSPTVDGGQAA